MKNSFYLLLTVILFSAIIFSCNKDDTVSPGGGNSTGPVTKSYTSNPGLNKTISNTGPVFDTINAIISDNILSNSISDIKLTLSDVSGVEVDKIKFSLVHGSTEIILINQLTKTGVGNFTNTELWDQATTLIDQGQSPYTGTFKPQNPLSGFNNADPAGNWIIKITYSGSIKTGVIKSWGITITFQVVPPSTNVLMPLAVGNKWLYTIDSSGVTLPEDTLYIPSTGNYNGKTVYYLYESRKPYNEMYLGNENNGLWGYSIIQNISRLMFKYPVNAGEWWIGGGSGDSTVCLSVNETVVTPGGTYTGCIKYQSFDGPYGYSYDYFKPGVGLIGTDKSGRIQRLKAFNPPPATMQILPTAVGNQWILEKRDAIGFRGYDSINILYSIFYQGKTLYRLIAENPNDTMYMTNESDGCYMYFYQNYILTSRLLYKYPISVGTMFIGGADGYDTIYCTSINATMSTPSGTYTDCIKYEQHKNGQLGSVYHIKPGLGFIAFDHNNGDYERLYSYHLNK
jgi:hypothetical protein